MKTTWTGIALAVVLTGCAGERHLEEPEVFFEGLLPVALAVEADRVFWTETPFLVTAGRVHAANADGSGYRVVAEVDDALPLGIAADGEHVFWRSARWGEGADSLDAANGAILVLSSSLEGSGALPALAAGSGHVFASRWTEAGTELVRVPSSGGPIEVLAPAGMPIGPIVTDGVRVFHARSGAGIFAVPVEGGAEELLATGLGDVMDLAADVTDVFAISDGGVWRVPKSGDTPERIASGGGRALAVDGEHVYWISASAGDVLRAEKSGANRTRIGGASTTAFDIAAGEDAIFWTSEAKILRLPK